MAVAQSIVCRYIRSRVSGMKGSEKDFTLDKGMGGQAAYNLMVDETSCRPDAHEE